MIRACRTGAVSEFVKLWKVTVLFKIMEYRERK